MDAIEGKCEETRRLFQDEKLNSGWPQEKSKLQGSKKWRCPTVLDCGVSSSGYRLLVRHNYKKSN